MAAPQGVLLCASAESCPGTFSQSNVCSGGGTRPALLVSFDCDTSSEECGREIFFRKKKCEKRALLVRSKHSNLADDFETRCAAVTALILPGGAW